MVIAHHLREAELLTKIHSKVEIHKKIKPKNILSKSPDQLLVSKLKSSSSLHSFTWILPLLLAACGSGGGSGSVPLNVAPSSLIVGTEGNTDIKGTAGNDTIKGTTGDDFIDGGTGNDDIDGGDGEDGVSYEISESGVNVSLARNIDSDGYIAGHTGGDAQGDRLKNISKLEGSDHDDILTGDDTDNALWGRDGNDILSGLGGNDTLDGQKGADILTGGGGADTFIISEATNTIGAADIITDLSFAEGDELSFSSDITHIWIKNDNKMATSIASNDASLDDVIVYADRNFETILVILEDYTDDVSSHLGDGISLVI